MIQNEDTYFTFHNNNATVGVHTKASGILEISFTEPANESASFCENLDLRVRRSLSQHQVTCVGINSSTIGIHQVAIPTTVSSNNIPHIVILLKGDYAEVMKIHSQTNSSEKLFEERYLKI